jgi:SAM-dependent methyltransferase
MTAEKTCRFCRSELSVSFADLGMSPLSNAYLRKEKLEQMEPFFPLHAFVCGSCFLVQLEEFESPEGIFSDYAYFSSFSDSWLRHSKNYTGQMIERLALNGSSQVVEIASNDGYLLQYFKERGIPVLGVEPAANVARTAVEKGIPTEVMFFGAETAHGLKAKGRIADLLIGNNVLAHVPDLNGFVKGLKILLKPEGTITMEFPHLLRLMRENQFDTIYHEHFSYLSLLTVEKVFAAHGLTIYDVDQISTHGGSLRIYARHQENTKLAVRPSVAKLRDEETASGLTRMETYRLFAEQVRKTKRRLLDFLIRAKESGKTIVGYGAAAKGNTLLNYCGIRQDFVDYVVDRNPHKQDHYLPGTHIPIHSPERLFETKPDYLLILPWNIKAEVMDTMSGIREWGGKFVVPIPEVTVL